MEGVTFSKRLKPATLLQVTSSMGVFHVYKVVQMVPNRATHRMEIILLDGH